MIRLLIVALLISHISHAQDSRIFMFLNNRSDKPELPKEEVDRIMKGHMENINKMAAEGKLVAAGPFEGGGGIFIFNAKSSEEVMEWVKPDPGIQANRWRVETLPFTSRTGSICKVSEPYQMVMYSFVRFSPSPNRTETENVNKLLQAHDEHMKKIAQMEGTVTEATFGSGGSIYVSKNEIDKTLFESDPAVKAGALQVEFKKLYIAKGSFCEK